MNANPKYEEPVPGKIAYLPLKNKPKAQPKRLTFTTALLLLVCAAILVEIVAQVSILKGF